MTNEQAERVAKIIADNIRPPTQAQVDILYIRAGKAARVGGGRKLEDCPFEGRNGDLWRQGWHQIDTPLWTY
jgi:hypothetical protein